MKIIYYEAFFTDRISREIMSSSSNRGTKNSFLISQKRDTDKLLISQQQGKNEN